MRLIDADELKKLIVCFPETTLLTPNQVLYMINNAPTIKVYGARGIIREEDKE